MPSESAWHELYEKLIQQDVGSYSLNAPLAVHSSWQIGGPADLLIEPDTSEKVASILRFTDIHHIPLVVFGQGSNLLFDDAGLRGIALKLGENFSRIVIAGHRITAEAGAWVPGLARKAMQAGLEGLEHIIGIPGTVGGLVLMNGGSQRKSIGDNVHRVTIATRQGNIRVLDPQDCDFSYRSSALQKTGAVILLVELECPSGDPRDIRRKMIADLRERRRKFPRKEPNCGSVFLSTSAMHETVGPPGKIVEDAGLKGFRVGGAQVSFRHANFIVNLGGATSRDVLSVIAHIRRVIQQTIGFELDCEVRYVSPNGQIVPAHQALHEPSDPKTPSTVVPS